jgi:hypothetical protein
MKAWGGRSKSKNAKPPFPQGTAAVDFFFSLSPGLPMSSPAPAHGEGDAASCTLAGSPPSSHAVGSNASGAQGTDRQRPGSGPAADRAAPIVGLCGQGPAFPFGSLSVQHEVAHRMETSVPTGQGTQTGRWLPHTAQDPYAVWVGPHPGLSATPASAGSAAVPVEAGCGSVGFPPTPTPQPGKVMVPAAMSGHGLPPTDGVGGADPAAPPHHPHHHHAHWTQRGVPTWPGLPGVDAGVGVAACPTPQSTADPCQWHILEQHTDHGGLHPPVYVAAPAPVVEPSASWQGGWQPAPPSYLGGWAQASGGPGRHGLPPGVGWALAPQIPPWHHFGSLDTAGSGSNWPPGPGAQPGWLSGPGPRVPPTPPQQGFPAPHAWAAPPGSGPGWHWVQDWQPCTQVENQYLPFSFSVFSFVCFVVVDLLLVSRPAALCVACVGRRRTGHPSRATHLLGGTHTSGGRRV